MRSGPTRPTMFPPTTLPRLSRSAPCRPSSPAPSSPVRTSAIPGRSTSTSRQRKVSNVIYQLPCNCRCDRALGHTSLRSCYEGLHGTECSTCARKAFYAYRRPSSANRPRDPRRHRPPRVREPSTSKAVEKSRAQAQPGITAQSPANRAGPPLPTLQPSAPPSARDRRRSRIHPPCRPPPASEPVAAPPAPRKCASTAAAST
jgi:hypothetical protein